MGEVQPALNRIDHLINRARGATAVLMASLALGGGAAIEASVDTAAAEAHEPAPHLVKPGHIQEYAQVIASDPDGVQLQKFPAGTFVLRESCQYKGYDVKRRVVVKNPNQPLGKCDIGSLVKVSEDSPLEDSWTHRSKTTQKVAKATRTNNNFTFIEQRNGPMGGPPVPPQHYGNATPTPAPTQPEQPAPDPDPTPVSAPYASGNVGVDISWPQCGGIYESPTGYDFGIVDVNNGLGYSTNPCLANEAAAFPDDQLNLYVNTGWYDQSSHIDPNSPRVCEANNKNCLARNYGYNAGLYAVNAAAEQGITSATWWLDVEANGTWSENVEENQNSLQGEHDALIDSGVETVGVYSTTVQWGDITGGWQNNWPSWGATTWTTAEDAKTYCTGHQFTGGPSELMQFTPTDQLDEDVAC